MTDLALESLVEENREQTRLTLVPDLGSAAVAPEMPTSVIVFPVPIVAPLIEGVKAVQIEEDRYEQNLIFNRGEFLIGAARIVSANEAEWDFRDPIDETFRNDATAIFVERLGTEPCNYDDCVAAIISDVAEANPSIRYVRYTGVVGDSVKPKLPSGWGVQYAYTGPKVNFFGDSVGFTSEPYVARHQANIPGNHTKTIISRHK